MLWHVGCKLERNSKWSSVHFAIQIFGWVHNVYYTSVIPSSLSKAVKYSWVPTLSKGTNRSKQKTVFWYLMLRFPANVPAFRIDKFPISSIWGGKFFKYAKQSHPLKLISSVYLWFRSTECHRQASNDRRSEVGQGKLVNDSIKSTFRKKT